MISQELIDAYTTTKYIVFLPKQEYVIQIGQKHEVIDKLLNGPVKEWTYITAYNPESKILSKEENEQLQQDLKKEIINMKHVYFEGKGVGEDPSWEPELSLLVLGISYQSAKALGEKFGQNAIVCGKIGEKADLIFCKEMS